MPVRKDHLKILNDAIEDYYVKNRITPEKIKLANEFVDLLKLTLESTVFQGETIEADIDGSLRNGFAAMDSDVDITLRIKGEQQPKRDVIEGYLRRICKPLGRLGCRVHRGQLFARVPVLRVEWAPVGHNLVLEVDITFYREIALHHGNLLRAYYDWDQRVPKLGLYIKKWAHYCGIESAKNNGNLNSFGWIIMMVHYLQRVSPPVLPFLQQIGGSVQDRFEPYYKHNVYFYKGPNKAINGYRQNEMTVAELFIGFLGYFADYNFERRAVGIHRAKVARRSYTIRGINIQDPFTLLYIGVKKQQCGKRRDTIIDCLAESYEIFSQGKIPIELQAQETWSVNCMMVYETSLFAACPKSEGVTSNDLEDIYISNYGIMSKNERKKARNRLRQEIEDMTMIILIFLCFAIR